jgi:CDP-diacylglycerol---glycerol-3-phosphate 3-phosphatidyltransferase
VSHGAVPDRLAEGARTGLSPVARRLAALGVSANAVTVAGGILTLIGAGLLAAGMPLSALVVLLIGTLADTLDGQIAKASGGGTVFGAFLDSTVDRVSDAALFCGAALAAMSTSEPALLWAALLALVASSLVPYVRAKAESLGVRASVGPAPREARIVIFLLGLGAWALLGLEPVFTGAVLVVAVLASITAAMRVTHVSRQLQIKGR